MKILPWIIALWPWHLLPPTPAPAASGGPANPVYRFSGLRDDGGASGAGVASAATRAVPAVPLAFFDWEMPKNVDHSGQSSPATLPPPAKATSTRVAPAVPLALFDWEMPTNVAHSGQSSPATAPSTRTAPAVSLALFDWEMPTNVAHPR
jgi:hypothetical protein